MKMQSGKWFYSIMISMVLVHRIQMLIANLRILFALIMDEFNIDLCVS